MPFPHKPEVAWCHHILPTSARESTCPRFSDCERWLCLWPYRLPLYKSTKEQKNKINFWILNWLAKNAKWKLCLYSLVMMRMVSLGVFALNSSLSLFFLWINWWLSMPRFTRRWFDDFIECIQSYRTVNV